MPSSEKAFLTFHVVPHFTIPATTNSPLTLGTLVHNRDTLVPLNRFFVEDPGKLIYDPVTQKNFVDTLATVRRLNVSGWAKFLGLPAGGAASVGASNDLEEGVECDEVVTTYFDPDPAGVYVKKSLAKKPVRDWIDKCKDRTADLYLVTGLKVARNLRFNKASEKSKKAELEASMKEPTTETEIGTKVDGERGEKKKLEFTVDDIVIGYRVNKYRCTRKRFRKDWTTSDEGLLEGNMQDDEEDDQDEPVKTVFEAVIDPDELAAQDAAGPKASECWVGASKQSLAAK